MRQLKHIGLNKNIMLLPEHTEQAVRQALEDGAFYFATVASHSRKERDPAGIPVIHHIDHDQRTNVITIHADCEGEALNDDAFRWITTGGKIVAQGPALKFILMNEIRLLKSGRSEGMEKNIF